MSRINYNEDWDDTAALLRGYAWMGNVERSLKGKRGQVALRKLEAALEALPRGADGRGRLLNGSLLKPVPQLDNEYEVCALGALCLAEGMDPWKLFVTWEKRDARSEHWWQSDNDDRDYDADELMKLGPDLGMSETMAWAIIEQNDESFGYGYTPEERWERVLEWVRSRLR